MPILIHMQFFMHNGTCSRDNRTKLIDCKLSEFLCSEEVFEVPWHNAHVKNGGHQMSDRSLLSLAIGMNSRKLIFFIGGTAHLKRNENGVSCLTPCDHWKSSKGF